MGGFTNVVAHGNKIKAITKGVTVTPKGLAPGQNAKTPQKFGMAGSNVGVALANGGKIKPQRG